MGTDTRLVNRSGAARGAFARTRAALAAAALLALAGCTNPVDQRGNLPDPDKLAQIKPGVTTKAAVTQLLGSPSSIAAFDDNTWYYISQRTRPVVFTNPKLLDQEVVAIDFDNNGIVLDLTRKTMADAEAITPNPNATPAPGREFSVIEQLLGNLGRFSGQPKGNGTASGK
jgi:outer membrane protein assembly factor BamE (lipoprotein component of BamABCDE complex)